MEALLPGVGELLPAVYAALAAAGVAAVLLVKRRSNSAQPDAAAEADKASVGGGGATTQHKGHAPSAAAAAVGDGAGQNTGAGEKSSSGESSSVRRRRRRAQEAADNRDVDSGNNNNKRSDSSGGLVPPRISLRRTSSGVAGQVDRVTAEDMPLTATDYHALRSAMLGLVGQLLGGRLPDAPMLADPSCSTDIAKAYLHLLVNLALDHEAETRFLFPARDAQVDEAGAGKSKKRRKSRSGGGDRGGGDKSSRDMSAAAVGQRLQAAAQAMFEDMGLAHAAARPGVLPADESLLRICDEPQLSHAFLTAQVLPALFLQLWGQFESNGQLKDVEQSDDEAEARLELAQAFFEFTEGLDDIYLRLFAYVSHYFCHQAALQAEVAGEDEQGRLRLQIASLKQFLVLFDRAEMFMRASYRAFVEASAVALCRLFARLILVLDKGHGEVKTSLEEAEGDSTELEAAAAADAASQEGRLSQAEEQSAALRAQLGPASS